MKKYYKVYCRYCGVSKINVYIPYTYENDSIYGSVMNIFGLVQAYLWYKMKTLTVAYTAYCVLRHSYLFILLLVQVGEGQAPSISSNGKYDQIMQG